MLVLQRPAAATAVRGENPAGIQDRRVLEGVRELVDDGALEKVVMPRSARRPTRIGPLTNIHEEPEGWSLRVTRGGHDFADYFGDAVYGGRDRALLAAQRARDELLRRIDPDQRVRRRQPKGSRSRTGVVGVSREPYVVDGRIYHRYVAHWQDLEAGRARRRRFLVERYGEEEAKALAIGEREKGVARARAYLLAHQREEAERRLRKTPPKPRQVKDPRSRKGISMARRRSRREK